MTLDWQLKRSPRMPMQSSECVLAERFGHQHVVETKSLYDALSKESTSGRSDRTTAVDMNLLRETLHQTGDDSLGVSSSDDCRSDDEVGYQ